MCLHPPNKYLTGNAFSWPLSFAGPALFEFHWAAPECMSQNFDPEEEFCPMKSRVEC